MDYSPPHTPRIKPVPLPILPFIPERACKYSSVWWPLPCQWTYVLDQTDRDGQLTPLTPHPLAQQIHESLQPTPDGAPSFFYYDLKDPPSKIIFGDKHYTTAILKMPATTSPLKQLRILLPTPTSISVIVSSSPFVSVIDVLEAIYSSLHAPISPSVGDDLDLPSETSLSSARTLLPPRGNSYDYHPFKILLPDSPRRKIDYLKDRTTFAGLTLCNAREGFGPVTWKLHTLWTNELTRILV